MSLVTLSRLEAENGPLPPVCMRCDAPATVQVCRPLTFYPPKSAYLFLVVAGILFLATINMFGALLGGGIGFLLTGKWIKLAGPLCVRHKNHLYWRGPIMITVGAILVLICIALFPLNRALGNDESVQVAHFWLMVFTFFWFAKMVSNHQSGIHVIEATADKITLTDVSGHFAEALKKMRVEREAIQAGSGSNALPSPPDDRIFDPRNRPIA